MVSVVNIELEEHENEKIYFISTPSSRDGMPLFLTKDMSLTRVKANKAFVRDLNKVSKLAGKIFAGEIREGIAYGLFSKDA